MAYLGVEHDRPHPRETLAGLLWPDYAERSARQSLSQALFGLRDALGDRAAQPPYLVITRDTLKFNRESVYQMDVAAFSDDLATLQDLAAGQAEEGLAAIEEALECAERADERYYEVEILRIHGELLLLRGADPEEVDDCYRRGIEVAQRQEARSFELRATISLAKLLQGQGRGAEARGMLAAIYGWFSEGFDTPDLLEAKALLEVLG